MSPHKPDSAIYILYIVMVSQISNVVDSYIRFTLCTYVKNKKKVALLHSH